MKLVHSSVLIVKKQDEIISKEDSLNIIRKLLENKKILIVDDTMFNIIALKALITAAT